MDTIASDIVAFVNDYSLGLATPLNGGGMVGTGR